MSLYEKLVSGVKAKGNTHCVTMQCRHSRLVSTNDVITAVSLLIPCAVKVKMHALFASSNAVMPDFVSEQNFGVLATIALI